jgi:hypothetical protein
MRSRPSTPVLLLLAVAWLAFVAVLAASRGGEGAVEGNRALVEGLGLTDPVLFTEARYTRHLSLTDFHSPFQDQPGALEHFPSGALTPPPYGLTHAPLAR